MTLAFAKYQGTGNDFVVVERALLGPDPSPSTVSAICDRHFGVGADGILVVGEKNGLPSMRVLNADGSVPEMCGNGLRCVVAYLVHTGRVAGDRVTVETDAGPHDCVIHGAPDRLEVEVRMRVPTLAPENVPVRADAPLRDADFEVDGRRLHLTAVSMGNPHAVTFDDVGDASSALGPRIERDPRFPEGVNVGFARMHEGAIDLRVFERGSGWTQACGTGACAAAVAAVETGRIRRGSTVTVRLPGGPLTITVGAADEPVRMRGPAALVFEGRIDLARFGGDA